jgi:hypothetical protein
MAMYGYVIEIRRFFNNQYPGEPSKRCSIPFAETQCSSTQATYDPFKWAMFLYHMLRVFPFAAAFLNMQNSRQTHQRDIVPGTNPVKMIQNDCFAYKWQLYAVFIFEKPCSC